MFAADKVNVPVPVLFVSTPAPEITPDNVWFDDDEYVNVLLVGIVINPAYDAGDTLAPRVPDTVMFPPESLIVVLPL